MMSFNKTMLSLAMESGEVPQPESFEVPARTDSEEIEDYLELANHGAAEITRGFATVEALESLAKKYESQDVTESSMEQYRADVSLVLAISGAGVPASVIVPSFEAATEDKKTIGQKSKGVIDALIKWIKERWEALKARFKQLMSKLGISKAKADVQHKAFKSAYMQAGDVIKCGPVPAKFVTDGHFDHEALIKFAKDSQTGEMKEMMEVDHKTAVGNPEKLNLALMKWEDRRGGKSVSDYTVTKGEAELVEEALYDAATAAKTSADIFIKNINTANEFTKSLDALQKEGPPTSEVVAQRQNLQRLLALYTAQMTFATNVAMVLFDLHSSFAHVAPGAEEKKEDK